MSIVILLILLAVGINLAVGFGLAALFFKDGQSRTVAGIAIGIVGMIATAAIVYAGCSSMFTNMH